MAEQLVIPYGGAAPTLQDGATPRVIIDRAKAAPLRLSDGPYPFPEPPDLLRLSTLPERLDLLKEHLESLCGLWDRPARLFLDAYFRHIGAAIAAHEVELGTLAAAAGGLFMPADWSFAAPRPLPQAHLPVSDAAGVTHIRTDFAFWTGAALVAIELLGSATPRKQRREELARLRQSGVVVIEISAAELQRQGEGLLARLLPAPFHRFWEGVSLPLSPFAPLALDRIRDEADQSSISMT